MAVITSPLKPRLRKISGTFKEYLPRSALVQEMYKTALGESRIPFPPSDVDGVWKGYPVRIMYAGEDRVVFNMYNPKAKNKWITVMLPAPLFYPFFSPLREIDSKGMDAIIRDYLSRAKRLERMTIPRKNIGDPRKQLLEEINMLLFEENKPYLTIVEKIVSGQPITRRDMEALLDYYASILPRIATVMERLGLNKNTVRSIVERATTYILDVKNKLPATIDPDTVDYIIHSLDKIITNILRKNALEVYNPRTRR